MAFIIKEHRPGRFRAMIMLSVVLWMASIWAVFEYGQSYSKAKLDLELARNQTLQEELFIRTMANREMLAKISILERTAQVDREAKIELAHTVRDLQDKAAELREDVTFYKSIVSPEKGHSGINVYSLTITDAGSDIYHYKMVLTQAGKNANLAVGGVDMLINGILDGQEKQLNFSQIQLSEDQVLVYEFRYFQEMSGSFRLPKGFSAREVVIKLTRKKGNKIKQPVRRFDWTNVRGIE